MPCSIRAQPDFTVVNLPTTLRLPKWKSAFRVTHRFTRPLGEGRLRRSRSRTSSGWTPARSSASSSASASAAGTQVGVLRTSDRTIQFFGQYDVKPSRSRFRWASPRTRRSTARTTSATAIRRRSASIVSRTINKHAAVYVQPMWVNNTNGLPTELIDDNDTLMLGVGARVRITADRLRGGRVDPAGRRVRPGRARRSFGIEKRVGGHSFQFNFSNTFGTTMGQVARGGDSTTRTGISGSTFRGSSSRGLSSRPEGSATLAGSGTSVVGQRAGAPARSPIVHEPDHRSNPGSQPQTPCPASLKRTLIVVLAVLAVMQFVGPARDQSADQSGAPARRSP